MDADRIEVHFKDYDNMLSLLEGNKTDSASAAGYSQNLILMVIFAQSVLARETSNHTWIFLIYGLYSCLFCCITGMFFLSPILKRNIPNYFKAGFALFLLSLFNSVSVPDISGTVPTCFMFPYRRAFINLCWVLFHIYCFQYIHCRSDDRYAYRLNGLGV